MGLWDSVKNAVGGALGNPVVQAGLGAATGGGSTLAGQALGLNALAGGVPGGAPGMLGQLAPHASPPNAAAQRGQPRGGQAPNVANYSLGGDPNWLNNFANGQAGVANDASRLGYQAAQYGNQGAGLMQQGNQLGERGAPTTAYNPQVAQLQGGSQQAGQQQYGLANQLQTLAGQQQGPSAAQAQLQMGTDQALQSQLALARSGSGFGESSSAMQQAQMNAAGIQGNAANQAAMLRANEDQAARARQLQALGMSGEALGQGRAADLALGQQQIGQSQFGTQAALQAGQQNDAARLGMVNAGLQAQNMGLAGQAQGLQAQNQANQLALQAAQAQQQGLSDYERGLTDIYQIDTGAHEKARELNQQNSTNWINGITGLAQGVGSLAKLSDRRAKHKVEYEDLSRVYRALGGA